MKVRNLHVSPVNFARMFRLGVLLLLAPAIPALAQVNGAIYTTTPTGTTVNGNLYDAKTSVYLSGGPQNSKDAGLQPDGNYYFQVTDPSGAVLLSADDISCRQVVVANGRVTRVPSPKPAQCVSNLHPLGTTDPASGETPVQLCPVASSPRTDNLGAGTNFDAYNWCDTTPNPGGEYKAWLTPVSSYNNCSKSNSNMRYGFCDSDSKTDNFKVNKSNSAYITVCKFNDLDANGVKGTSEPLVPGWPIKATGVDTLSGPIGTLNTQTDTDGCVSFSVSNFTTANGQVTISEGALTGSWRQTAPASGTYTVPDGTASNGTLTVTMTNSGLPTNMQSLKVAAGQHITLKNFGNTCMNSTCGGNAIELTVTEDANPSLTRTYTWGITKGVDASTVYALGTASSSPANYTVTVSHDNGTDSAWQSTGTINVSNPSWVDLGGVDVTETVNNGGTCTITNGSAITIPAKSEVNVPYTCTYSSRPANGINTGTASWNSGSATPGKVIATASMNFSNPAIKVVDGSATVTDKLDNVTASTLGTATSSAPSPAVYTYYRTFTDPAGLCTSHTNRATFTTNTTQGTGSASATVQNCSVKAPSATCLAINAVQGAPITPLTMVASGGTGTGYTFTATGLPAGLTMASNGTISGTPTVSGTFTYTVTVKDSKGYTGTTTCSLTVASSAKATITVTAANSTLKYPNSQNLVACVTLSGNALPNGTISFYDGATLLTTQPISNTACLYWWVTPALQVGTHSIKAVYNDTSNKNVTSTAITITVNPGDITSEVDCWVANFAYGPNYQCDANNDSGSFTGYMTYSYDGGAPVVVQMNATGHALFTIPQPVVGTHHVVITYPAQGNWSANTLPLQTFTVTPAQTQVALVPSPSYAPLTGLITFSASLTSPSAGAPKSLGTVSFSEGATLLAKVAVNANGQASFSTSGLTTGYHTITASYSGGGDFGVATDSKTIQIGGPILTWAAPAAINYGTALNATQLNATASVAGTLVFSPAADTILAPGQQSLKVTFTPADTAHYTVQSSAVVLTVNKAPQTITLTAPSIGKVNTPITLVATGGASGSPITYTVAGPATLSGTTLTPTGTGTVTVTANQAGNTNYLAATPVTQTITVANSTGTATVTMTAATATLKYPASENLVPCVKLSNNAAPTGTISIYDGGILLTTQPMNSSSCVYWWATPSLPVGSHTLTATYNDSSNKNVTSAPVTVTVNRGDLTSTVNCWNTNFTYGADYQCDAYNTSGAFTGYMTYSYDGGAPVTVQMNASGHALFSIHLPLVGTHKVAVVYPQQGNFNAYALPVQTFTVTAAQTQVSLTPSTYYAKKGTSITFNVTLTSQSAGVPAGVGTVSFNDGSTLLGKGTVDATGKVSFSTASLAVGAHNISATYSGGGNFAAASAATSIQVTQ